MKKLSAALLILLGLASAALAQMVVNFPNTTGGGAQALTASATGTTGAVSATLTANATRWTYICGFTVTSGGTTGANVQTVTITGTVTGTMSFIYVFVSAGQGVLGVAFPGCISSSAINTPIVVNVPGGGAGTTVAANAWGYTN
jgi:hypothetical protein